MKEGISLKVSVIVPSLNPDDKLLKVVEDLLKVNFNEIIVVNDGSEREKEKYFDIIAKKEKCIVLKHSKNLGKGRALKTAFNYFLNNRKDQIGVVTVDGDGQHDINDVIKCAKALEKEKNKLILGVRNFNAKNVPPRSKFGNKMTSFAFKSLCGVNISDTQTGLRGVPLKFIEEIINLSGERFDYETNMLLETKRKNIGIKEVPIKTLYLDENTSSHFNPLTDSLSIYKVIGAFVWSSIASMVCDFSLFTLLSFLFNSLPLKVNLFIATFGARLVSSLFNFFINKKVVFSNDGSIKIVMIKYYTLCIIQVSLSYLFVYLLSSYLNFNSLLAKIIVDFILFLVSFKLQLGWVFKNTEN